MTGTAALAYVAGAWPVAELQGLRLKTWQNRSRARTSRGNHVPSGSRASDWAGGVGRLGQCDLGQAGVDRERVALYDPAGPRVSSPVIGQVVAGAHRVVMTGTARSAYVAGASEVERSGPSTLKDITDQTSPILEHFREIARSLPRQQDTEDGLTELSADIEAFSLLCAEATRLILD